MLNALRSAARTMAAKVLIALLIFSFAVWGVSGFLTGPGGAEVATVGSASVDALEFQRAYQNAVQRQSQELGRALTPAQAQALNIPGLVLGEMVQRALLEDAAVSLGLDVGDERVAAAIRSEPVFAGPDGTFDRATFEALLRSAGFNERDFVETERDRLRQRLVVEAVAGGLAVPDAYLRAVNTYQNEERTVDWFRLGEDDVGPIPDPTPSELEAFFEENRSRFRAPEYRSVELVELAPESIADPDAIGERDVAAAYEASADYGEPERRRVRQLVFQERAAANQALADLEAGTPFDEVATALGRSPAEADLGLVERAEILDASVAEAAFAMDAGEARIVNGRFGPVLVEVSEIAPAAKRPLAEVADEIRRTLALERAEAEIGDLYDAIEDAFAGGATVAEVAARFGLEARTIEAVSQSGLDPSGVQVDLPGGSELVAEAFDSDVGVENAPIRTGRDTYVWYRVTGVEPARDRTLEEARAEVILAWTADQIEARLQAMADEAVSRLEAGEPPAEVARSYGAELATADGLTRRTGQDPGGFPADALAAAFAGPVGYVASVPVGEIADRVVLKVTGVTSPVFFEGAADLEPVRTELTQSMGDTLVGSYVAALQRAREVTVNEALFRQIVGLDGDRAGL